MPACLVMSAAFVLPVPGNCSIKTHDTAISIPLRQSSCQLLIPDQLPLKYQQSYDGQMRSRLT